MQRNTLKQRLMLQENLESILESLQVGIIAHDLQRRIIYFNKAAEEITGYKREELLGKDCHLVFSEPFCGGLCHFKNGAPSSFPKDPYEVSILARDGSAKRLQMRITPMEKNGGLAGVLASFQDITRRLDYEILKGAPINFHGLLAKDPKMLQVIKRIRELAIVDYPLYIQGETGTGKELVARALHEESRRAGGPFVSVNCAALPPGLIESELFGHEKGAFTGAIKAKKGRFELADKGTLFLDEIGELDRALQSKLLRVVETGELVRVGGEAQIRVEVRVICATNRDLKSEVRRGRFREDLYFRLTGLPIYIPPLRQRPQDIPVLIEHFSKVIQEEGLSPKVFSKEAMEMLLAYKWPGNVRELQSAIRFAYLHSETDTITPQGLPPGLNRWDYQRKAPYMPDRDTIESAIEKAGGNRSKAARALGMSRASFYRHLSRLKGVS